MPAGRPAKPTALKLIQGTARPDRINANEPKPAITAPAAPSWLAAEAKREWRRVVKELARLGLMTRLDRAALAGYCQAYARWVQAEQVLTEHGMTFTTPSGYVQQRPEVSIAQKSAQLMRGFMVEFGMTPSSRAKVQAAPQEERDPFEELFGDRGTG